MDKSVTETAPLRVEVEGDVGLIVLASPPVNALGQAVRQGLLDALAQLNADVAVKVIAIYGEGKMLSAGADIREFGQTPQSPSLPDVLNAIENSDKPVAAVIHGVAMGGGLELALSAHARVGLPGARVGLPEVTLGLLPGAGGTQRLPRLAPLESVIEIITSGRQVPVREAISLGIIDGLDYDTPRGAALTLAHEILSGEIQTRRTGHIAFTPDQAVLVAAKAKLATKRSALPAPLKCVDAIAASALPIEEGMKVERALFLELMESPERQGLIHAFQAERAVKRIPESAAEPRPLASAGVIGGGTMGVGIATALLQSGFTVTLIEMTQEGADKARERIEGNLAGAVKRGKMTAAARDEKLTQLTAAVGLDHLADVDVVIEAVFEDMKVKTQIFRDLDRICKPGTVLGTNTSYLDVNEIAAATSRPQDVIGLHFFSPAHIMRLLEVVVAEKTAPDVVATAFAMAARMKKVAVRSGVCDGFIGNRILAHYRKVADYMLLDGASFEQIDSALEDFGFAMGPFAVGDLAGQDIGWATRKRKAPTRPAEERYSRVSDLICEEGCFGRKTGKGYYLYDNPKSRVPNPGAEAIVTSEREAEGRVSRSFTDDEIIDRYMAAMISEAARVVEEGIALRPVDVDAVFLFGYGFPRHLGGPLNYADRIGAAALVERIEGYAKEDPYYWQVPDLLRELAQSGRSFADLNKE
ncbi:3-hydroxyacyl-CoA dehydrogenase NAD-binding domain-containing protein [Paracoccus albus]|uniref:3-hydroxyacyl-CoA dehydrogenase NAD-binding domain-containing protein n=1 Tax=Paracoccus albus TaxID=3017784 RepID=UPI0022F0639B|nr:3-hydroxyacyl-CoA dehydrogenase NAD-binding domain-containing protein [Paracoccus albus]WBU59227.1 3-hydroxyacyl-CoA dehydrogenase NAD-binding domain-containing protein [Paracoccus albus]